VTPRRRATAGMTLVELLVSMALLASLGALIVQLMRNSFDLYSAGERRGEYAASATGILDRIDEDLRNVVTAPPGRFLLEHRGGAGSTSPTTLLRFVRTPPQGEARHPTLRTSGTVARPETAYTGRDPGPDLRGKIEPASGLMEVCYAVVQDPELDVGVLTLYRGERAPAFKAGATFFDPEVVEPDAAWVRANLTPVASGILALRFFCRAEASIPWDEEAVLNGAAVSNGVYGGWDSTRAIAPASIFPHHIGAASLGEPRDDVFPSDVRTTLIVGRPGRPDARIGRRFGSGGTDLTVDRPERLPRATDEDRVVKVGTEWVEVKANETWGASVARERRRSSAAAMVEVGAPVYVGKTFRLTTPLPPSVGPSKDPIR
jgi:hypothetical protein